MNGTGHHPDSPNHVLTLVICTYNNSDSLRKVLAQIATQDTQSLRDCAILVINNNCTDNTAAVVAATLAQGCLPGLRHILEPRQGLAHARLRGVAEARTEWIAFIDDDNFLLDGWIANAKSFIRHHPRCGAFGGRIEISWEIPPPQVLRRNDYAYASLDLGTHARRLHGEERWHLRGAGLVCRVSALVASGWTTWQACTGRSGCATTSGDDLEIVMRIAREGYELWYEPSCSMRHLISARRISLPYIEKLHFGFGMAHPLLVGFKYRQSRAGWAIRLARSIVRDAIRLMARGIASISDPIKLAEARLTWSYLHGTLCGIPHALRLGIQERRNWLGHPPTTRPIRSGTHG